MKFSEIVRLPPEAVSYPGSPALLRRSDGALLAAHDFFSASWQENLTPRITWIHISWDDGAHWQLFSQIDGAFWSSLFELDGTLYLLGTECEYGDRVIRRSRDGGRSWSGPAVLQKAGPGRVAPNCHQCANPVLRHRNRIFKAVELYDNRAGDGRWSAAGFSAQIISADAESDLMNAENWRFSNTLPFDPGWFPGMAGPDSGWVEGTLVTAPDGQIRNLMRAHLTIPNRAFSLTVSPDGARLDFDPATGLIEIPAGPSKLAVRRDEKSGWYLALTNPINDSRFPIARNVLALSASRDLTHWRRLADLVTDDSGLTEKESAALTGFQYPDFLIEGADLIYLVRMAHRGARNYHDSNEIGFFRLSNFRNILKHRYPIGTLRATPEPA